MPDHFFGGIPLIQLGSGPSGGSSPGGGQNGGVPTPGTPPTGQQPVVPAVDPQQLLAGRPPGTGWVDADDPLPPGWYVNPVTGEVGPLFPPDSTATAGDLPVPRPGWLPHQYGYLPDGATLPDGWHIDSASGQLVPPPGFASGQPAPVQIGAAAGTVQPSNAWPGSYEVNLRDADGILHQHQISYDANGYPVIGDDADGVSQLSDLSGLDDTPAGASLVDASSVDASAVDTSGFDAATVDTSGFGASLSTAAGGGGTGGGEVPDFGAFDTSGAGLTTPDFSDASTTTDLGVDGDQDTRGLTDGQSSPTVVPAPSSWSPDSPATNLSATGSASLPPLAGAPLTAASAAGGHGGAPGFVPMMPMMPTGGDQAKPSSRYVAPAAPSELVDEEDLAHIDTMGPVIGSKE